MKKITEHYPGEWDISLKTLKTLISGKGSLRAAFWGVWVIGTMLIGLIIYLALATYSGISNSSGVFNWFEKHDTLVLFPYMLFGYLLILKNKICIKPYWVPIARVYATVIILGNAYDIYTSI